MQLKLHPGNRGQVFNFEFLAMTLTGKPGQIYLIVTVIDENGISIVTALNHVMWHIGCHHTTNPWHFKLRLR